MTTCSTDAMFRRLLIFGFTIWLTFLRADESPVHAAFVSLQPSQDNTLYEFDPADLESPFNSNGAGDMFSAGRSRSRGLLRRGLIQFDFSELPADAEVIPGTLELLLHVVDSPQRDVSGASRPFWLMPLHQAWGEGSSAANAGVSGSGSGAAATVGDATWLHTSYDPAIHDPRNPQPDTTGYWEITGAVGATPFDPAVLDQVGTVPAAPYLGPVTWSSISMESDVNAWLADPSQNFGWLVLGDESVTDPEQSTNRGFASRENAELAPQLSFEYRIVPEASSTALLICGSLITFLRRRRRPRQLLRGRFSIDHAQ